MSEKPFIRFFNIEGNEVLKLKADTPGHLIKKALEHAEVIENLKYDHHTTNIRDFTGDDK